MKIKVGARASKLSQKQVEEVLQEIRLYFPTIDFDLLTLTTTGDQNQQTSLRFLDKTDFFTKEIDALLISQQCRIAIHSAKDLPEPLSKGLRLIALTKGQAVSDALVLKHEMSWQDLPKGALIGSSSIRRDIAIRKLRIDLIPIEVRGTIEKRLNFLFEDQIQGLIVAEAALIRLDLTHLNRILLPHAPPPLQGKLAVVAREQDREMAELFSHIDVR